MDGNGRWAQQRKLPRVEGHRIGSERVEEVIQAASEAGVRYLTFYAFSKENWNRPKQEVDFLMKLLEHNLDRKASFFHKHKIAFRQIGDLEDFSPGLREKLKRMTAETQVYQGLTAIFALSYSSREEIVRACRRLAEKAVAGKIRPGEISQETLSADLYTAGIPDPDLLIRTSGEMRISNFLLWQISYAELYVTDIFWPDFGKESFWAALEAYGRRERRFGLVESVKKPETP